MYVAWRDLRFARGRFVLMTAVVALITLLVGFLAGLAGGLASQNVSAVLALPGDRLVLQQPASGSPSFSESSLPASTTAAWRHADGVTSVVPVGIVQGRVASGERPVAVALVGLPHTDGATSIGSLAPKSGDGIGLSSAAADQLGARPGSQVMVAGRSFTVGTVGHDLWYSHLPVVVLSPEAWSSVDLSLGGSGDATVLAVSGHPDWSAVEAQTQTSASGHLASLTALPTFTSEIGSLGLMIGMLFVVSALVVGAFFTVWSMQRTGDVAVLKALGATTSSLVRDALGQAAVVLVVGIGVGLAAVVGLALIAPSGLPFVLDPLTTLLPGAALALLGLAGAAVALRSVTHADPLTALGSNR
ncbi:ABC transporter permease [Nocardioides sp.]|uniref:FtsX-like permease family protein n=1 Tax=Nocardioides sp. TaxID=35761 RepID=UPI00263887F1|nr:ABC transporter permease [Nocardioides sp.]